MFMFIFSFGGGEKKHVWSQAFFAPFGEWYTLIFLNEADSKFLSTVNKTEFYCPNDGAWGPMRKKRISRKDMWKVVAQWENEPWGTRLAGFASAAETGCSADLWEGLAPPYFLSKRRNSQPIREFIQVIVILSDPANLPLRNMLMSLQSIFLNKNFSAELTWRAQHGIVGWGTAGVPVLLSAIYLTLVFMFRSVTEGADLRVIVTDRSIQLGSYKG